MSDYVVAPEAQCDLLVIWYRFAEDVGDADLADRMVGEIVAGFHKLARVPGLGHSRRDLSDEPLLFWAVRSWLIIDRIEKRPIEIVRVLHGSRDVKAILDDGGRISGEGA